jgi:hypothetical protein
MSWRELTESFQLNASSIPTRRGVMLMAIDEIRQAKRLADHALSRVRLTADRRQKELWQAIADEWLQRVAMLEQRAVDEKSEGTPLPEKSEAEHRPEKRRTSKPPTR